jgi:hypothetical protein
MSTVSSTSRRAGAPVTVLAVVALSAGLLAACGSESADDAEVRSGYSLNANEHEGHRQGSSVNQNEHEGHRPAPNVNENEHLRRPNLAP